MENLKILKNYWQLVLNYRLSLQDIPYLIQGAAIAFAFGMLFYDSYIAVIALLPIIIPWFIYQKRLEKIRNRRLIGIQFMDAMISVTTNLKAGYSIENAFREAGKDMVLLYGKKSLICGYLNRIYKGIANNIPLEKLLINFGNESENTDILDFASVFAIAKKSGGNMTDIISRSVYVISKKIEVEKEIDVLVSAKRMEARIMNLVPFFIILYVSITSPGFFSPLYHNLFGIILMSICMGVYIGAYLLSEKIVNITV